MKDQYNLFEIEKNMRGALNGIQNLIFNQTK